MRWESLFDDLEGQLEAEEAAELVAEVADRTRREVARLCLVDRLRAAVGAPLVVYVLGCGAIRGSLDVMRADCLLLTDDAGRSCLVPMHAVAGVSGLARESDEPGGDGVVAGRLDLRYALRGLARSRETVTVTVTDGSQGAGTIDRVGADFIELAEHDPGEPRRASAVRVLRTVPTAAIALVRASRMPG